MYSSIVSEVWDEIKRFVNVQDKEEAADAIISILINNDEDIEDIKSAFKGDSDMKRALASYLDDEDENDAESEDDYSYDEDDEDDF